MQQRAALLARPAAAAPAGTAAAIGRRRLQPGHRRRRCVLAGSSSGGGGGNNPAEKLGRELLDVVTAGPKMRKWYGQESSLPRDGGGMPPPEDDDERQQSQQQQPQQFADDGAVFVVDADGGSTAELLVLKLIVARAAPIRALVRDVQAAKLGFGPYVTPVSVDDSDAAALARALRGARAVVLPSGRGGRAVLQAARQAGVARAVLLSTAGMPQPSGLGALLQGGAGRALADPAREAAVAAAGLPQHVVLRVPAVIRDEPGGQRGVTAAAATSAAAAAGAGSNGGGGGGGGGAGISREDVADALVAAAVGLPGLANGGGGVTIELRDAGAGAPPPGSWAQLLDEAFAAAGAAKR